MTIALIVGLGACGTGSSSDVVVRVGSSAITGATVDHWITVMAGGRSHQGSSSRRSLRRPALRLLISSRWIAGEAEAQGLKVTDSDIRRRLRARESESSGDAAEYAEFLRASGQSRADLEMEVRTELEASRLRGFATKGVAAITSSEVAAFYAQHIKMFMVAERRVVRETDRKTWKAAKLAEQEARAGKDLLTARQHRFKEGVIHVTVGVGRVNRLEAAIDTANPTALVGPVKLQRDYFVFEVTKVIPEHVIALRRVSDGIRRRLTAEHRRRAWAAFLEGWRRRWTGATDCRPGYIVPGCRQFRQVVKSGEYPGFG